MNRKAYGVLAMVIFILMPFISCSEDNPTGSNGSDPDPGTDTLSTVTDIDGNVYQTITIGTQVWMKENLKVTHFRNGDSIPYVTDFNVWNDMTTPACCSYNNDINNGHNMGLLYNNFTVHDDRKIAPEGWHIASDEEWQTLIGFLGGDHVAGGKLKEAGLSNWSTPNTGATNESGFTALPSGVRAFNQNFMYIGYNTFFWTTTLENNSGLIEAIYRILRHDSNGIGRNEASSYSQRSGYSVRCIKD